MNTKEKIFFICLILFSSCSIAGKLNSFEIPRSSVVEIKDTENGLIYPLFIKLPKSYEKNNSKNYPVIYLTDAWYAFQIISGSTRYPMNVGKMKEAIIVGISYSKGSKKDSSRVRDYTPSTSPQWKQQTGRAHQHMAFIEKDVFQYIEKNYRAENHNRTFVGNSLGGLFGSYILLKNPGMFQNYIIGSPSYWYDDKVIFKMENKLSKTNHKINANVFISIGERETKSLESSYEMVEDAKIFYQKIRAWKQPGIKVKMIVIPEASHHTAFPTTAIQGLYWVLKKL